MEVHRVSKGSYTAGGKLRSDEVDVEAGVHLGYTPSNPPPPSISLKHYVSAILQETGGDGGCDDAYSD